MAIREIYFTVTSGGISPNTEQQAGIQSEHAATSLIFTIDSALYQSLNDGKDTTDTIVYRFDCFDSTGGVVRTEAKPLSNRAVSLTLGENLTRNGGKAKVYLVISRFNAELKTEVELLSYPAKLRFENLPEASENSGESAESISTLTEVAKEAANKASESATAAATSAIKAETATQAAENAVEKANTATQAAETAVRKATETLAKTEVELSEHNTSDTAHEDIREAVEKVSGELVEKQNKFADVDEYGSITMSDLSSGMAIRGKYGGSLYFDNTNGGVALEGDNVSLQAGNSSLYLYNNGIYLSDLKIVGVKTPAKDNEAANKGYVDSQIAAQISTALKRETVNELPAVSEAETNIVYMVPAKEASEDNYYNEYLKIVSVEDVLKVSGDTGLLNAISGESYIKSDTKLKLSSYGPANDMVNASVSFTYTDSDGVAREATFTVEAGSELDSAVSDYVSNPSQDGIYYLIDLTNYGIEGGVTNCGWKKFKTENVARYELIGSSKCDLSGYATIAYVDSLIGDIDTTLAALVDVEE